MKMMQIESSRYPYQSAIYFALTFVISWGAVLLAAGPAGIPATPDEAERHLPVVVFATLAGPSLAGLCLTWFYSGMGGLRALFRRFIKWRVPLSWYVVALLITPMLVAVLLLGLSIGSPEYLPGILVSDDKITLILIGIGYGLAAGLFEEVGWTGFALPKLRRGYSMLQTGLIIGLLWGVWHFLVALWGSGTSSGSLSLALFLPWVPWNLGVLPAFRVLMGWVYDHTQSLLLSMLMHASLTASLPLILMPAAIGVNLTIFYLILAAVLWILVAVVMMRDMRPAAARRVASEPAGRSAEVTQ